MADLAPRCAPAARERGDSLWGTAAPARRWLLIEHPGPWSPTALQSPGIGGRDAAAVAHLAAQTATRAVLVRRHGRDGSSPRTSDSPRSWRLVDVEARREVSGTWCEDDGLASAVAALDRWPQDDQPARPTVLVCTHGVHDACCAIWGRPVVAALDASTEDAWECSHLGGDRFAASLVVLPDGACYGGLDGASAVPVVAAHRAGAVAAAYLRGSSSVAGPAQAAIAAALERFGPAGFDDVRVADVEQRERDHWSVTLSGERGMPSRLTALVRRTWETPTRLTCNAVRDAAAFRYVVDLETP